MQRLVFDYWSKNAFALFFDNIYSSDQFTINRFCRFKDKQLVEKILNEIRIYFRQSGFFYKSESQVRILSGAEEGIFAMLAVNYLKEELLNVKFNLYLFCKLQNKNKNFKF